MSESPLQRMLSGKKPDSPTYGGYQRSLSVLPLSNRADTEIREFPVRDVQLAKALIEMRACCPEIETALEIISSDVFSSESGDETGFAIVEDEDYPFPNTIALARELQSRVFPGLTLYRVVDRFLSYGDCFGNLSIDFKARQIAGLMLLPTWEIFRIEDDYGNLQSFEQRQGSWGREKITLHPVTVVHWRYQQDSLYGRSLFRSSIGDWENLKMATQDVPQAARDMGVNPNVHTMHPGADENYKTQYRLDHESRRKAGIISDYYLLQGATIGKAGIRWNPDIKALIDNFNTWRNRIGMRSRVPPWLLGIELNKAREIAGQPALSFAIFIGHVRQVLGEGVRQMINTELALKGIPPDQWKYRLQFPRIATNPYEADVSEPGVEDMDFVVNGNGNGNGIYHLTSDRD